MPILDGEVDVYLSKEKLCVKTDKGGGVLVYGGKEYKLESGKEFVLNF